jgi:DNA-binding PadR family transcriptional regulator
MGGFGRHFALSEDDVADRWPSRGERRCHHPEEHRSHHHRGGRHGGRLFDYGELRLLLLAMIAERPRHGYELIKAIEERFGGSYSPSPGVVYPTLSWLEDMGYSAIDAEEGGRKRYRITPEGEAFLAANRTAADALLARTGPAGAGPVPAPVVRAMENLKLAMRLRLRRGPLDPAAAESVAAALDAAAQAVERS